MRLHFSPITRFAFFLVLAALFAATSAVVLAYGFGYRYNFERGIFIHSGSITLKTSPQRVRVFVDGESVERKKVNFVDGSITIDGLRPGPHTVSVSAPGFQTWSKSVLIESGKTAEFWNVLLVQESHSPEQVPDMRNVTGTFASPNEEFLAVASENNGELSVAILDADTFESEQIFSSRDFFRTSNWRANIEWSPKRDFLLIPVFSRGTTPENSFASPDEIFLVERENAASIPFLEANNLDALTGLRWGKNDDTLYALSQNTLLQFSLEQDEWVSEEIFEDVEAYDISSSHLFVLRTNGILYRSDDDGQNRRQISTSSPESFRADEAVSLNAYDENRIAAITESGRLFLWNAGDLGSYTHTLESVTGMQFSNDGKKLLFWGDTFIRAYFFREWDAQPKRQEDSFLDVGNFVSPISRVGWIESYEHILYEHSGRLSIIELDHRDQRTAMNLSVTLSSNPSVTQLFSKDRLFFTAPNPNDGSENILLHIPFLESEGLFGFGR